MRRGGDDFWHVKIILPPWIPCSTKPWLTTALRRSVHRESSLLAFTHTQGVFLSSALFEYYFSPGLFLRKVCCQKLFNFRSFLPRLELWIELFPPHNGATVPFIVKYWKGKVRRRRIRGEKRRKEGPDEYKSRGLIFQIR